MGKCTPASDTAAQLNYTILAVSAGCLEQSPKFKEWTHPLQPSSINMLLSAVSALVQSKVLKFKLLAASKLQRGKRNTMTEKQLWVHSFSFTALLLQDTSEEGAEQWQEEAHRVEPVPLSVGNIRAGLVPKQSQGAVAVVPWHGAPVPQPSALEQQLKKLWDSDMREPPAVQSQNKDWKAAAKQIKFQVPDFWSKCSRTIRWKSGLRRNRHTCAEKG